MRKPRRLADHAHIRVVAPASPCQPAAVERTASWLEERGYRVSLGEHVYDVHRIFAGSDEDRARDLIEALLDPSVDAVFAARGGYGSVRLIPYLEQQNLFRADPKIFLGYSDMTALHSYFHSRCGWVTFHGPMMESRWLGIQGDTALGVLRGEVTVLGPGRLEPLQLSAPPPACPWYGGNLTVLASLAGTPYFPVLAGAVLYLEDVQEAPYRIDRMLQQLQLAGCLDGVEGIVFGEATHCDPEDADYTVQDAFQDFCSQWQIPGWWGFPAGHGDTNLTLPLGVVAQFKEHSLYMVEEAVR